MFKNNPITLFQVNAENDTPKTISQSPSVMEKIKEDDLAIIIKCIEDVNEVITISSALSGREMHASTVDNARKSIHEEIVKRLLGRGSNEININLILKLLTIAIKTQHAGNCEEFSLYAYSLLIKNKIASEIFRIENGNHVFVVVNRDKATSTSDFTAWNAGAIVVDPFFRKIYTGSEIPELLQSCSYNPASGVVSYIPFDREHHKLDNSVLSNILEDWQQVVTALGKTLKK